MSEPEDRAEITVSIQLTATPGEGAGVRLRELLAKTLARDGFRWRSMDVKTRRMIPCPPPDAGRDDT